MSKRPVKTPEAAFAPMAPKAPPTVTMADALPIADGLQNWASGQGTSADKRSYATYRPVWAMNEVQQNAMFRGSWLANRIVSTPAEDMTREWFSMAWDGVDQKQLSAIKAVEQRFDVRGKTFLGVLWSRLTSGAAAIVGLRGEDLSTPLNLNGIKKGALQILHLVDRWWLSPIGVPDRDLESPNYGLPEFYQVRDSSVSVHWSRVIRFEGRIIPADEFRRNGFWHDSELQHVVESVKDYDSVKGGIAALMEEAKVDVIKTELAKILAKKGGKQLLEDRYAQAALGKSLFRTLLLDTGEDYEQKTQNFTGLPDVLTSFVVDVCGAAEVPMLRLFGQSSAGMNATGEVDLRAYYDRIASLQQNKLLPVLIRIYDVVVRSALGFMPDDFEITFNKLWKPTALEQSTTDLNNANRDQIYILQKVATPGLVMRELKAQNTYRTAEDKDVELAEQLALKPDPPAPDPGVLPPAAPPKKGAPPVAPQPPPA